MRAGVCSWSLRPTSPQHLAESVKCCGLSAVQLALDPFIRDNWNLQKTLEAFTKNGVDVVSAMVQPEGEDYTTLDSIRETGGLRPTQHWLINLSMARTAAQLCDEIGCQLVTFHAGFMPHDKTHPEFKIMLDRVRRFSEIFLNRDIRVALETGQESAETLAFFLDELGNDGIGVNFDPANMILYDMGDPIEALSRLAPRVFQIHLKDARRTAHPGEWGTEVPVGEGEVRWDAFFRVIEQHKLDVNLVFEREAGERRVRDIVKGLDYLTPHLRKLGAKK